MKKILSLLLVASLILALTLTLVSCGKDDENQNTPAADNTPKNIYELFAAMQPTRTVTLVTYKIGEDELKGIYDMQVSGKDSIFEFSYDKYRTSQEAIEDNDPSKIKTVTGTVYCKNGLYSGDGVSWGASPVATEIKLTIAESLFSASALSTDGKTLTAIVANDKVADVFGTELNSNEDGVTLIINTNGTYVTRLTATYVTVEGAEVRIETSYSYNALTLNFPA